MKISRPYTVVLPSLQISATEREYDGRRFYLMIKIYPDGTLTPTLASIVAGQLIYRPKVLNCLRQGLSEICEVIHLHSADLIALESVGWILARQIAHKIFISFALYVAMNHVPCNFSKASASAS